MNRWLIITLLLSATLAMAQTEDPAGADPLEGTPDPCAFLEEDESIPEDDPLLAECENRERTSESPELAADISEPTSGSPELATETPEPTSESPELAAEIPDQDIPDAPIDENELPSEATVDEEFNPEDEISEDYPIPLPADI